MRFKKTVNRKPATPAQRRTGWLSKKRGESFEEQLRIKAKFQGVTVVDIPDGCQQVGANKIIRVKSPFDFVFAYMQFAVFIDAKTTKEDRVQKSKIPTHQIDQLSALTKHVNMKAGFLIWFVEKGTVEFFDVRLLHEKGSLRSGEGLHLGSRDQVDFRKLFFADLHGAQP